MARHLPTFLTGDLVAFLGAVREDAETGFAAVGASLGRPMGAVGAFLGEGGAGGACAGLGCPGVAVASAGTARDRCPAPVTSERLNVGLAGVSSASSDSVTYRLGAAPPVALTQAALMRSSCSAVKELMHASGV